MVPRGVSRKAGETPALLCMTAAVKMEREECEVAVVLMGCCGRAVRGMHAPTTMEWWVPAAALVRLHACMYAQILC